MEKRKAYKTPSPPQFKDYIGLIRRECWKRVAHNPLLDWDELISAGHTAFLDAVASWKPKRGKFSTHLVWKLKDRLGKIQGCRNYVPLEDWEVLEIPDEREDPLRILSFRESLAALSGEALEVVWLILVSPTELVDWTAPVIIPTQKSIRAFLTEALKWKHALVDSVFKEIRAMLKTL